MKCLLFIGRNQGKKIKNNWEQKWSRHLSQ
ncbi:MAG: hypothetical protein ACI9A7_001866 [Cyclobacteriaceae bacterium]